MKEYRSQVVDLLNRWRWKEALPILKAHLEDDKSWAQAQLLILGLDWIGGYGSTRLYEAGISTHWFDKETDVDPAEPMGWVAFGCYFLSRKDQDRIPMALKALEKAGESGCAEGWTALGKFWTQGYFTREGGYSEFPPSPMKAAEYFEEAVTLKDPEAMYELGLLKDSGFEVALDWPSALELYRLSAAQGYPPARVAVQVLQDPTALPLFPEEPGMEVYSEKNAVNKPLLDQLKGFGKDYCDDKGNNLLYQIMSYSMYTQFHALLLFRSGVDLYQENNEGNCALQILFSQRKNWYNFPGWAGLDLDRSDSRGRTPLMLAVEATADEWVKWLLARGVDLQTVAADGRTAVQMCLDSIENPKGVAFTSDHNRPYQWKILLRLIQAGAKVDFLMGNGSFFKALEEEWRIDRKVQKELLEIFKSNGLIAPEGLKKQLQKDLTTRLDRLHGLPEDLSDAQKGEVTELGKKIAEIIWTNALDQLRADFKKGLELINPGNSIHLWDYFLKGFTYDRCYRNTWTKNFSPYSEGLLLLYLNCPFRQRYLPETELHIFHLKGQLEDQEKEILPLFANLRQFKADDLSLLAFLPNCREIDLSDNEGLRELSGLSSIKGLQKLNLRNCAGLKNLEALEGCKNLEDLDLDGCRQITDFAPIATLPNLKSLNLMNCKVESLEVFSEMKSLQRLNLEGCTRLKEISGIQNLSNLKSLTLGGCTAVNPGFSFSFPPGLETLDLSDNPWLTDLQALTRIQGLKSLTLENCIHLADLAGLEGHQVLRTLDLSRCKAISDASFIGRMPHLKTLYLNGCSKLPWELVSKYSFYDNDDWG